MSLVFAVKDEEEMKTIHQAAKLSSLIMKNYLVKEIAGFIDSNKKISHAKISSMLDHVLLDDKKRQN
jgi:nucleosome binding factor SPN SPT16 subunit